VVGLQGDVRWLDVHLVPLPLADDQFDLFFRTGPGIDAFQLLHRSIDRLVVGGGGIAFAGRIELAVVEHDRPWRVEAGDVGAVHPAQHPRDDVRRGVVAA